MAAMRLSWSSIVGANCAILGASGGLKPGPEWLPRTVVCRSHFDPRIEQSRATRLKTARVSASRAYCDL